MPLSEFDRIADALTDPVNEAQLEGWVRDQMIRAYNRSLAEQYALFEHLGEG